MRTLVLTLVLAGAFLAVPAFASADQPCQQPWFEAYDCWFGHVGAQQVTICGKNWGSYCIPIW